MLYKISPTCYQRWFVKPCSLERTWCKQTLALSTSFKFWSNFQTIVWSRRKFRSHLSKRKHSLIHNIFPDVSSMKLKQSTNIFRPLKILACLPSELYGFCKMVHWHPLLRSPSFVSSKYGAAKRVFLPLLLASKVGQYIVLLWEAFVVGG